MLTIAVIGSREYRDAKAFSKIMDQVTEGLSIDQILVAKAQGVGALALKWAERHEIPSCDVMLEIAPWTDRDGPSRRDYHTTMLDNAERFIVFWDGKDQDVSTLCKMARMRGKPVKLIFIDPPAPEDELEALVEELEEGWKQALEEELDVGG